MRHVSSVLAEAVRGSLFLRLPVLSAILASLVAFSVLYQPVVVQGKSMLPSLHDGQVLLMDRQYYRFHQVKADDIVILRHGKEMLVKRVFATAGQTVSVIRSDEGITSLIETPEQRADATRLLRRRPALGRLEALRVPLRCVYVVGDNANYSLDSRDFGPVPDREIVGYVPSPPLSQDEGHRSTVQVALR